MTKKTKGKKNRRERSKYPALDKRLNLSVRNDYIETDHINGVYNENDEQVIRPFTEEEKAWYNQFYEETVITNFWFNDKLKELKLKKQKIVNTNEIRELSRRIKESKTNKEKDDLKEIKKLCKEQIEEDNYDELEKINSTIRSVQKEVLLMKTDEQRRECFRDNNVRNRCLYNNRKKRGHLIDLDAYPDVLMSNRIDDQNPEEILIAREVAEDMGKKKD